MLHCKKYLLIILCFCTIASYCQNQTSKWYFGTQAGLDFMTSPPTILLNSAMSTNRGSSVASDAAGNLLFYTDGTTVWNQLHAVMGIIPPNFSFVGGQQVLIVKQPGNTNIYFIFTQSANTPGLRYTIVDMNLASGLGAFTSVNNPLPLVTPGMNSLLAGVKQCNGNVWVMAHQYGTSNFLAFEVTPLGVTPTAVVSTIGGLSNASLSSLKFSQQGNKLCCYLNGGGGGTTLFDFNQFTGVVTNSLFLPTASTWQEFSPDGTKLYTNSSGNTLLQWDLCSGNATSILASQYTVAPFLADLNLAQDGKIYVGRTNDGFLGVINNPNLAGSACNYSAIAQSLGGKICKGILPNFVSGYIGQPQALNPFFSSVACETLSCLPPPVCVGQGYTLTGLQWDFGDPSSGALNTSTLSNPQHRYQSTGIYTVQLVISFNGICSPRTDTLRQAINITQLSPSLTVSGGTFCTTQTASFSTLSNALAYQWLGPNGFNSMLSSPVFTNPTQSVSGNYTISVFSPLGCATRSVVNLLVLPPPTVNISLSSKTLCAQALNGSANSIILTTGGATSYTLYTPNLLSSVPLSGTSSSLSSMPPFSNTITVGTATLIGFNGVCSSSATAVFSVIPNPNVTINSYTPVICAGQHFTYTSNGANSYTWSASTPNYTTYSNGGVAVAHPSINAVFSVYGGSLGCNSALVTSSITVYALPSISLSAASASICLHNSTTLKASGTGTSFQWLPNIGLNQTNTASVTANPLATQIYTLIATANNCTNTADILLTVLPLPVPTIINPKDKICLGDSIHLSGTGGVIYNWMGPDNFSVMGKDVAFLALHQGYGGQYTLTVTDESACRNSTLTAIEILPLPSGSFLDFKEDVCVPYCTTYQFAGLNNNFLQSSWKINGTNFNANKFYKCFSSAGTYTFEGSMKDAQTGCKAQLSYVLTVHEKPKADFNYSPLHPIQEIDEVQFVNTSQGNDLIKFNWFFNDNKGFTSKNSNTNYLYSEPGEYPVVLIAENIWSCRDTILKIITVDSDFAIFVPNSFTPNDDGRNDVFMPVVRSASHFDFKIYDRWGKEIFHSKSPQDGWDGSFMGELCKQDVYTWVIELTTNQGEHLQKTGTVTLIR